MQPGAPVLWPAAPDNIAAEMRHGDAAATDAAFAGAAHRVALDIVNQRLAPAPMEPRSVLAYLDGERLTRAHVAARCPPACAPAWPAAIPGRTAENVRVLVGDVGGGFGMKTGIYPEDIVARPGPRCS